MSKNIVSNHKYQIGTTVRFTSDYLSKMSDKDRKRYENRVGVISGYRLQDTPTPLPIVTFPKIGRYKAEAHYEMLFLNLELVNPETN